MITQESLNSREYHSPSYITKLAKTLLNAPICKKDKKEFFNIACAFDIETTSFYAPLNGKNVKQATMYEWTLGLDGDIIIGRDWISFLECCDILSTELKLSYDRRLIIYVHNLAFEFQWIRRWFDWYKVFSLENRKVIYAITRGGIEFRCSYMLSGYSLRKLSDELHMFNISKMVGDLDYKLIRHSSTPLTEKEIGYCLNDVKVVMAYIQEKINSDGNIIKIPITKTGYVRNYCRNNCFYTGTNHHQGGKKYAIYKSLMKSLTVTPEEYKQLKRAFQGGFTHANVVWSGKVVENVRSFDFTSSYPSVMIAEKFPMSKARDVEIHSEDQFNYLLDRYCCLFDIEFINLKPKVFFENPIARSKCYEAENVTENNGRVVSADKIAMTLTEQDFFTIREFYEWDEIGIFNFKIYDKAYLPTDFVKAILKLYKDKTVLKGIDGMEEEYLASKEMLNACYGMIVTDICRDETLYEDENWSIRLTETDIAIDKYNNNYRRFLFYPWGIWVTAYARRNLFSGIKECGYDYIYSDTDSIKCVYAEEHMDYFNKYNEEIEEKLHKAMLFHGLTDEEFKPKTIKGKEKILGVWDDEGIYEKFKTLGAKRYMTLKHNELSITVSGLNKITVVPYLQSLGKDPFELFEDDLYIPKEYTGKNTHTYIDESMDGVIVDYLGNSNLYMERSGVHLEEADYSMSLSDKYLNYLLGFRDWIRV